MLDESIREQLQREDPIDITKEQWMTILEDPDVITEQDIQLLKLIFDRKDCKASSSQLAQSLTMPYHAPINSQVGRLGKRIAEKLNIQVPMRIPPIHKKTPPYSIDEVIAMIKVASALL
jgi:hypothetical protein